MLLWFELTKINMEISKPLYVVSVKGTWKFPNPFTLCLWKEHGNAPLRCVCERNMEISKLLYVVSVKGTWKFPSPFTLRCLWKEHGNFQAPLRCVCERNMEISKPLYVVSVKGTWKFPNPFTLYLWKEHGNFQAPLRCVCERNMEISKPFYVVSVKGTWKFPGPFTLRLWKEHGNFQTPWRCTPLWKEHGNFQAPLRCVCERNMEISKPLYVVLSKFFKLAKSWPFWYEGIHSLPSFSMNRNLHVLPSQKTDFCTARNMKFVFWEVAFRSRHPVPEKKCWRHPPAIHPF